MKKSLEEITIERTNTHIQRGADGVDRKVTRSIKQKLYVKTINAGLRFVHLVVDYMILITVFYIIDSIPAVNHTLLALLNLLIFLSYPLIYLLMEYKFQQTPGKMVTSHVVIDKSANKPDFKTCLLRTLIRFVPFEPFSCFSSPSRGWHDEWSKTYVVHKDEVLKLKAILEKENSKQDVTL